MRLSDEQIADIKEYLNRSIKVTASSLIPQLSKYGLDLIGIIEALQQENEQLRAQVTSVIKILKQVESVFYKIDTDMVPETVNKLIDDALAKIDKAIGGKEDV